MLGLTIALGVGFIVLATFLWLTLAFLGRTLVKVQQLSLAHDEMMAIYTKDKEELDQYRAAHQALRDLVTRAQDQVYKDINVFNPDNSIN